MKKRCTNGACRKEFSLLPGIVRCPHCGKKYPRHQVARPIPKASRPKRAPVPNLSYKAAAGEGSSFAVVLTGWDGISRNRIALIKVLRTLRPMSLRPAVEALKRPTIVARGLSWRAAQEMALQLEEQHGIVALVPDRKAEKYGVPLSVG